MARSVATMLPTAALFQGPSVVRSSCTAADAAARFCHKTLFFSGVSPSRVVSDKGVGESGGDGLELIHRGEPGTSSNVGEVGTAAPFRAPPSCRLLLAFPARVIHSLCCLGRSWSGRLPPRVDGGGKGKGGRRRFVSPSPAQHSISPMDLISMLQRPSDPHNQYL